MTHDTPFQQRGWGIRVWDDPDRFQEAVERAVAEAQNYGINLIDLHDGAVPPRIGWVPLFAEYRQSPSLRKHSAFTYDGREVTHEQRDHYRNWFRELCQGIKKAGLRVNAWYHVLSNLPEELLAVESTISRWDGRRLWQVIGGQLDDFFSAVPEVDGLTITTNEVLANSIQDPGGVSPAERLRAIYQCAYESCRRNRRKLLIREVGYTAQEHEAFLTAVRPLPPDIVIMLKDSQGDWCHVDSPVNPSLHRLSGKTILVETDLYGEHWGRQDIPMCRPRQLHRMVRSWLPLNVVGAVGRVMVMQDHDAELVHVFDTPNAANVAAFSHLLQDPGPTLEDMNLWDPNAEAFDFRLWFDWLRNRFGKDASPYVVSALDRSPRVVRLAFYLGGAYFQNRSYLPDPSQFERTLWPWFVRQAELLGMDVLRWEKEEALRLIRQSLRDIELARPTLEQKHYDSLMRIFEQGRDVVLAYRVLIRLCHGRLQPSALPAALQEALDLSERLETVRGPHFFGSLPGRLRQLAQFIQDVTRGVPAEQAGHDLPEIVSDQVDDDAIDLEDMGLPIA